MVFYIRYYIRVLAGCQIKSVTDLWNSFQVAVKNVKSGDTLEFAGNYCETDAYTQIMIDKNLHIKGNISKDAQGNIVFHNMVIVTSLSVTVLM